LKYSKLDVHFSQLDFLLQNKFTSLSLAFKTDKLTLEKRLEIQERYRDLSEQNVEKEIKGLRSSVEVSDPHTTIQFFKKKKKKKIGGAITNDVFSNRGKNSFQICIFEIGQFGKISYKIGQERPDNYNRYLTDNK
jgi:hypothetical protein